MSAYLSPLPRKELYLLLCTSGICGLAGELAAAGKPITENELVSHIISGLDMDYQPIISALDVRPDDVTVDELFGMVATFDQRVEMFQVTGVGAFKSSANAASRGRGGGSTKGYHGGGDGGPLPQQRRRRRLLW